MNVLMQVIPNNKVLTEMFDIFHNYIRFSLLYTFNIVTLEERPDSRTLGNR